MAINKCTNTQKGFSKTIRPVFLALYKKKLKKIKNCQISYQAQQRLKDSNFQDLHFLKVIFSDKQAFLWEIQAILSRGCKTDNFESHNSL